MLNHHQGFLMNQQVVLTKHIFAESAHFCWVS